jgi:hypothetical protein
VFGTKAPCLGGKFIEPFLLFSLHNVVEVLVDLVGLGDGRRQVDQVLRSPCGDILQKKTFLKNEAKKLSHFKPLSL